jgi:hypothetical protein
MAEKENDKYEVLEKIGKSSFPSKHGDPWFHIPMGEY